MVSLTGHAVAAEQLYGGVQGQPAAPGRAGENAGDQLPGPVLAQALQVRHASWRGRPPGAVARGVAEGADSVMVKPGLPYLDIVAKVKQRFAVPVFAYQVSGEYAMIEAAVAAGAADRDALVLETLMAFKRAGCSGVLTYHAAHAARLLGG